MAGDAGRGGSSAGGNGLGGAAPAFDLNDVSFLYPLPAWSGRDDLLAPSLTGTQGPLMSRTLFEKVAPKVVDESHGGPADLYPVLRVVGVRVDPCFPGDATANPKCVKQIRLVIQPVGQDVTVTTALTTLDGAIHALYKLTDAQWTALVSDLGALRALAGGMTTRRPLGVHPVMLAEGLTGPYATALRTLVLKYAGESTLDSFAFFRVVKTDAAWEFTAADKTGTTFKKRTIALVNVEAQLADANLTNTTTPPDETSRFLMLQPEPASPTIFRLGGAADDRTMRDAYLVDNPTSTFNPRTLDCGSCHLTTRNLSYVVRTGQIDTSTWPERFRSSQYDLSRTDAMGDDPRSLRSFGYFGAKSSIAGRTINESAQIAAALSL